MQIEKEEATNDVNHFALLAVLFDDGVVLPLFFDLVFHEEVDRAILCSILLFAGSWLGCCSLL